MLKRAPEVTTQERVYDMPHLFFFVNLQEETIKAIFKLAVNGRLTLRVILV